MDVELNKLESDLQSEESSLHAELTKLGTVSAELNRRLQALQKKPTAPAMDERTLSAAREARVAAIQARQRANDGVKQQLFALKQQLQALTQQVLADEKARAAQQEAAAAAATAAQQVAVAPPPPPPQHHMAPASDAAPAKKRQSPRVKMQAAVDFQSDNNFFNGFSANISDGGLFVATINLLPLGTEVDLNFTLPSGQRVEAKGVVRWVREVNDNLPDAFPGLGVQFAGLSDSAQNAINEFLVQRDPLFFADAE